MSGETVPAYDVCRAWIYNDASPVKGSRKECVLRSGHYKEEITVGGPGKSWHTDCPDAVGKDRRIENRPTEYFHDHHDMCLVWADRADGAHPDERVAPGCRGSDVRSAPEVGGFAFESLSPAPVKKITGDLGDYVANIQIGGATLSVTGPARFVAALVRAFADAFEEESER